jgi:hypothetical protein
MNNSIDQASCNKMNDNKSIAMIAIVAALGLLGIIAIVTLNVLQLQQQADARGCHTSVAFNASQGRCFRP